MKAPEFPQGLTWLNSPPLRITDLKAKKVVLIDFWTYSCVNCIRSMPYLKEWHESYKDKGLVIIGVHTPEFAFEKEKENVLKAVKDFGIAYPVVMDNDYAIWQLYANRFWPRKYLVSKDGQIVYDHAGEGAYALTEEEIQKALLELNPKLSFTKPTSDDGSGGICYPVTPETYLGSLRGRPGQVWYTEGEWTIHPEFIEHTGNSEDFEDFILLKFEATEVNLVASSTETTSIKIKLNGRSVNEIKVDEPKMYNLFKSEELFEGELKVFVKGKGFKAYAFTFGGCV